MPMRFIKLLFALAVFASFTIGGSVFAEVFDPGEKGIDAGGRTREMYAQFAIGTLVTIAIKVQLI